MLSTGEIAVGALLLTPIVPTAVAGLALTTFAGLLGRLYLNAPGVREEGSLQPTEQGTALVEGRVDAGHRHRPHHRRPHRPPLEAAQGEGRRQRRLIARAGLSASRR